MPKQFIDLLSPVLLLFTQFPLVHRFVRARIGLQFRTVDCHLPQLYEVRLLTQLQRLREQSAQVLQMLLSQVCDYVVIWMLIGCQIARRHAVVCGLLKTSRSS
jgi:dynactin complex subunit